MIFIAYIGNILLAICGLPMAVEAVRKGYNTTNLLFLLLWLSGEVLTLIYVISLGDIPLLLNYIPNIVFLLIIIKYRLFPKKVIKKLDKAICI